MEIGWVGGSMGMGGNFGGRRRFMDGRELEDRGRVGGRELGSGES